MAYSLRVRQRIVELYHEGESTHEIAEVFGASKSGVRRVHQRFRERGTLEPLANKGGRPSQLTPELESKVRAFVASRPDATRVEIRSALDLDVTPQCISKWLKRLRLVLKKSRSMPVSRTGPMSPPPAVHGPKN